MTAQRQGSEPLRQETPDEPEQVSLGRSASRRAFAAVDLMQKAWNRQFSAALQRSKHK